LPETTEAPVLVIVDPANTANEAAVPKAGAAGPCADATDGSTTALTSVRLVAIPMPDSTLSQRREDGDRAAETTNVADALIGTRRERSTYRELSIATEST
jgi:hypothetical protein